MTKLYVGLALADSMVPADCTAYRQPLTAEQAKKVLNGCLCDKPEIVNCCNQSHQATLLALREKHVLDLTATVTDKPLVVSANVDDYILVLSVRGLPRLTDRHEYTSEEIDGATFAFGLWEVASPRPRRTI